MSANQIVLKTVLHSRVPNAKRDLQLILQALLRLGLHDLDNERGDLILKWKNARNAVGLLAMLLGILENM